MTPEEAIEIVIHCLGVLAGYEVCEECKIYGDDDLACREVARYAIEALKEVQRYQLIKDVTIGEIAEALKAFSEIGTVEECRETREKEIPKIPKFMRMIGEYNAMFICFCGYGFSYDCTDTEPFFCKKCGQVLRMESEE